MRVLAACCAVLVSSLGGAEPRVAQSDPPTTAELLEEIRALNRRLEDMEARHQKQREADRMRIQQLERRLSEMDRRSIDQVREDEIREIRATAPRADSSANVFDISSTGTGGNLLNPEITVFMDLGGSLSSRGRNKALNRFNLREVELDLRAAISPGADGVLILALGEEIEQAPGGDVDIDREVDIEEGYILFHTLPHDLSLKAGRFRTIFGRNNLLHTHDLPQVTRPLAVRNFLGPEGLMSTGASLSWLVPNPWDRFIEATVELVNSDGGAESPILGGPNADNPAVVGHVKYFQDVGETGSLELGGSYLFTHTSGDSNFDANVLGLDLTYQWIDPDPSTFRSFILQSELFWAQNDIDRGPFESSRNRSFGAYVFGQYQFHRDWYAGLRLDYSDFPDSELRGAEDWDLALSPYVSWYLSEFLRLRAEYQHRLFELDGDRSSEEAVFLQLTFVLGAHPPHPYWVHR